MSESCQCLRWYGRQMRVGSQTLGGPGMLTVGQDATIGETKACQNPKSGAGQQHHQTGNMPDSRERLSWYVQQMKVVSQGWGKREGGGGGGAYCWAGCSH